VTRVAAVQMTSSTEVKDNLAVTEALLAQAHVAGAEVVLLPENFALMSADDNERWQVRETLGQGPIQEFLANMARRYEFWLVGGTLSLLDGNQEKLCSSCLVYDPKGDRRARYDKIHLFDVELDGGESYRESEYYAAGEDIVVVDTPHGRLGIAVCYDLRFPELFRSMLDKQVEVFMIPAAFTAYTGRAHWEVLVRARAIENTAFVVAAGQSGRHANGRCTHGDSMVVDPWGNILNRRQVGEGLVVADLDLGELKSIRKKLPSVHHRKIGC